NAYIDVVLRANPLTFQEIREKMKMTFDEAIEKCGLAAKWRNQGREWGAIREKANAVITVLHTRFQSVPETVQKSIRSYSDLTALDSLLQAAVTCESIKDFRQNLIR
ncbi:MAG: hypothetical protein LBT46_09435, partial [Planctomycetaceae bacterium]|nr:hypothetical protein [Planctomycetaceae bacterium]